ncbi:MAG TPA: glutamate 5-kinase, partial [bacterium]|nr:glutamate 5-kinase [bacterium]
MKKSFKRIVIKAGTSILTSRDGKFSSGNLTRLGTEISRLYHKKKQIVLVSSGAIALGMEASGLTHRPTEMASLQACAAVGQGKLMHAYEKFFAKRGIHSAQLLLTRDGLEDRGRFLKARRTLEELIKMKTLPIVNENDTIATEEIAFGDNDVLSVQVAHLIQADLLVILSDVDGFYLKDG